LMLRLNIFKSWCIFHCTFLINYASSSSCLVQWKLPEEWGSSVPEHMKATFRDPDVVNCFPLGSYINNNENIWCSDQNVSFCHGNEYWNGRQAYIVKTVTYSEFIAHFENQQHDKYVNQKPKDKWMQPVSKNGICGCIDTSKEQYLPETSIQWDKCPVGLHPHPTNCSKYLSCDHGLIANELNCPGNLLFNGMTCDFPETVDCRPPPVDGGWSDECLPEGDCSVRCGEGLQACRRSCNNPAPQHGGKPCAGESVLFTSCVSNNIECANWTWTECTNWTECSEQCGGGIQTCQMHCPFTEPELKKQHCPELAIKTRSCNNEECIVPDNPEQNIPLYAGVGTALGLAGLATLTFLLYWTISRAAPRNSVLSFEQDNTNTLSNNPLHESNLIEFQSPN